MFESSPTDPCIPCILASVSSTLIFSGDPPELTTISGVPFPASGVPGAGVAAAFPLFCGTKVVMMKVKTEPEGRSSTIMNAFGSSIAAGACTVVSQYDGAASACASAYDCAMRGREA